MRMKSEWSLSIFVQIVQSTQSMEDSAGPMIIPLIYPRHPTSVAWQRPTRVNLASDEILGASTWTFNLVETFRRKNQKDMLQAL